MLCLCIRKVIIQSKSGIACSISLYFVCSISEASFACIFAAYGIALTSPLAHLLALDKPSKQTPLGFQQRRRLPYLYNPSRIQHYYAVEIQYRV